MLAGPGRDSATLILVIRERARHGDHASLLDASIISTGLGLLTWVFLLQPLATEPSPWLERLVSFSYPLSDILVLAILIRLLASAGVRSAAFYLMTASLGLFLLGDFGWAAINHIRYEPGWLLSRTMDEVFLSAFLLFGASALVPSMADVGQRGDAPALGLSRSRLALLMVATLVAPGLLAIEAARDAITDGFAIAFSSVALFTFVVARMALLVRTLEAQTRMLDSLARVDSLTGASNRRVLDERLPAELDRAVRQEAPVAVAMLDLDNFKTYNDRNGHEAGDHLLRAMVAIWQSRLRAVDTLVRYGRDEFVVILPDADWAQAHVIATRLGSTNDSGQTMSIGVAVWDREESADKLLYRADQSLFEAKRAGRDRIIMAEPARA